MNVISASSITGSALDAEKMRVDIVSQNIANANTTKGIDGKAYQRRIVAFESFLDAAAGPNMQGVRALNSSAMKILAKSSTTLSIPMLTKTAMSPCRM